MTDEKLYQIAKITKENGIDFMTTKNFIEGDEHTTWLEMAPVEEIADWIIAGLS